jgi:tetratricopeptide (TPR) repeat protein
MAAAAYSQTSGGDGWTLKGQIESGSGLDAGCTVELYDLGRHAVLSTADIRPDGGFEFRGAPAGNYFVTVVNLRGDEIYRGSVEISGPVTPPLTIRLGERDAPRPVEGFISVHQLQHPPSRKAFDAMAHAQRLSEAGDFAGAAAWLEKTIALSPEWADAHANLGAQYLRMGRYADSIRETRQSVSLDQPTAARLCNLALALLRSGDLEEAKQSVAAALRLKPDDGHAHYVMAILLLADHGTIQAVEAHLQIAAKELPWAMQVLDKIASKAPPPD